MMNVTQTVLKWYKALNLPSDWEDTIESALTAFTPFEIDKKDSPYAFLHEQEDKMLCLLYALYKCESFFENGKKLGIDDAILEETLKEVGRHACNYNRSNSGKKIGLYQIKWVGKILDGKIYCLGRLEFEMVVTKKTIEEYGIHPNDKILGVHIPRSGVPLSEELFEESFKMSKKFFTEHFPDFDYKFYTCNSWLLDPTLKKLLPEHSNIIKFQNKFNIIQKTESDSGIKIVFDSKATYDNIANYTPKTSLQKAFIKHINEGGKLYNGYGIIKA